MARVTVEDCLARVSNRFELVLLAAERAKKINCGESITIERDNDKNAVVALREIAEDKVDTSHLRRDLISNLQMRNKVDIIEEENLYAESQEDTDEETDFSDKTILMFDNNDTLDFNEFDPNSDDIDMEEEKN